MARLRYTNLSGTIAESPKLNLTDLTMACPTNAPTVAPPFILAITLDPDTVSEEIAWVTLHATGAAIWTISRGMERTTAVDHLFGAKWIHGPTAADFYPVVDFHVKSPAYGAKGGAKKGTDAIIYVGLPSQLWQRSVLEISKFSPFGRKVRRISLPIPSRFGNGIARTGRWGPGKDHPRRIGSKSRFNSALPSTPTILYSPSSSFTSDDTNKILHIKDAGVNGATLRTSIAQVIDGQHIVLATPASSNLF